jgi:hypothetical protein
MSSKMSVKNRIKITAGKDSKIGQGYNDARGEIPDKKDTPKNNGQNVNNDPSHYRVEENKA